MSFVAVSVGIGVASAGVGIASQASAASAQNRYRQSLGISQNKAYIQNAAAVIKDVGFQIDQLARRDIETTAAAQNTLQNKVREVREVSAAVRTQQAAAGVEGVSIDLLHQQFARDVAEFESTTMRSLKNFKAQSAAEAESIYARGQSAINSGYPSPLPPAQTVNPFASILNGITTGISVYGGLRGGGFGGGGGGGAAGGSTPTQTPYFLQANPTTPYLLSR